MILKINNFAKIKEAEIILDGITVIAGYNDTGKSTIGKVLYSIFNSLHSIDRKISFKRKHDIKNICTEIINGVCRDPFEDELAADFDRWLNLSANDELAQKILKFDGELSVEDFRSLIIDELDMKDASSVDDYLESSYSRISAIKNMPDRVLYKEVVERFFSNVFLAQMNNCYDPDSKASVTATIKEKDVNLVFTGNKCVDIDMPIKIIHEAYFIDDPFILDDVNIRTMGNSGSSLRNQMIRKITSPQRDIMDGIFDAVISKESLEDIYHVLNKVVNGVVRNSKSGMELVTAGHEEPISVVNLSAGLKGFIIIKTLLERGIIKESDILILDEPEIHMHTQWQLIYAEIIVLLQKYFHLTILVTTHSSHFLQAIEYFSKKYELQSKCNYYLSKKEENGVIFNNVTEDTNRIYLQMVEPSIALDRLNEELEYDNEQ